MKKILVLIAVMFFCLAYNGIADADFNAGFEKVLGDPGAYYDLSFNERFKHLSIFGEGKFSSKYDGTFDIKTDEWTLGLSKDWNDKFIASIEFNEDYRSEDTVKFLDMNAKYKFSNGIGIGPSIKRNCVTNISQYLVRLDWTFKSLFDWRRID